MKKKLATAIGVLAVTGGVALLLRALYLNPLDSLLDEHARWVYGIVGAAATYAGIKAFKD